MPERGRTLIISGEAGAGKSSLLAAIAARAKGRRFLVGHGTAAPVEGAWPYAPVIEAFGQHLRGLERHRRTAVTRGLPDLLRLMPDLVAEPDNGRDTDSDPSTTEPSHQHGGQSGDLIGRLSRLLRHPDPPR